MHRVRGEEAPEQAALAYEKELRALAALERPRSELPVFDLVLLGLGGDGHTASLFPHSDALAVEERFAVATEAPDGSPRVTVTYPVINAARRVWFLVSGAEKAGMVAEVLEGLQVPNAVPAQGVRPVHGKLTWLLDEAAAAELSPALRAADRTRSCSGGLAARRSVGNDRRQGRRRPSTHRQASAEWQTSTSRRSPRRRPSSCPSSRSSSPRRPGRDRACSRGRS